MKIIIEGEPKEIAALELILKSDNKISSEKRRFVSISLPMYAWADVCAVLDGKLHYCSDQRFEEIKDTIRRQSRL